MTNEPDNSEERTASFDFKLSPSFRVIHVDGVWGGATPHGLVQMALFSDRKPFPSRVTYRPRDDGGLEEVSREQSDASFEREIEVSAMLSVEVAKSLASWLLDKVRDIERVRAQATGASQTESE